MDTSNWRPTPPSGEPTMDAGDWRSQLPPESRQRIVNKIMETLKRRLPCSGHEGLNELKKIAVRFEEKIFSAASSQQDYLRRISLKMLTLESNVSANPPDPGSKIMQQVHNQAQLQGNQNQVSQQLLSQNIQSNLPTTGVQSSSGLTSTLPSVPGINQNPLPGGGGGLNTSMQNMSGGSQNMVGGQTSQGMQANMFANQQRQMQGRPQVLPQQHQQQQQQQSQNLVYQQQLLRQKFQQGNLQHSIMQSQMQPQQQQQQQQNLLQPTQQQGMQSSSVQPPSMQSSLLGITPNQQSSVQQSMLQQHPQSVLRQQAQPQQSAGLHQATMTQQSLMSQQKQPPTSQQQQQQLMSQQPNVSNMQQNQLIGQQNNLGDIQQQQQQRLSGQQNNLQNLQQQQQQQQLMAQQNNLSSMHQQQLGSQSNVSGLQQLPQQQLLGTHPANSSMQTDQHALQMLQSKVSVQHMQQAAPIALATQGQASHGQQAQQQMMQMQSQPTQLQQQLGMQQQSNLLQHDMQHRLQTSGQVSSTLLQSQNIMDQQKQLYQAQRAVPETSSTSLDSTAQTANANGGDWQEEIYQKIRNMKELYFLELSEMYNKINSKLTQHDIPQAAKPEQFEKLKILKLMLERMISFLNVSKNSIVPAFKEKVGQYEKQIISFMNSNRPRRPSSQQQAQMPQSHMHPLQQPHPQITQAQSHDSQMNSQVQAMNLQNTMPIMQQSSVANLQHNSMSSLSGASTAQQQMLGQLQQSSNLDSGQGNTVGSMPQVVPSSLHNAGSAPQQANVNTLPSQGGVNIMQHNMNSIQSNTTMLQNPHLKQQQEQQILQAHQLKQQIQQRQMQQYMQKQQLIQQHQQPQQQQQQLKQQMHAQLQTQQIPQLHQMNEANDMKMRQGMSVKPGVYQQLPTSQRPGYTHSQLKPGAQFPGSSPQLLTTASPQMHQNSSPQVEQQSVLSSITKSGTPLQSANSPFVVPSPSTPMDPSPMPGETEKPVPGTSSLSNVSNVHQQTTGMQAGAQSLAIGTPGISASPLLLESTCADGTLPNPWTGPGKSNLTEEPLERLIKAVGAISSKALTASVSDISSVVSMIDRIAGSAPGNGSRAAIGEDLVAMTKCRLQAKNFITQDGMIGTKKMRRYTSAVPLNVVSSAGSGNDSFKQLTISETSDLESTATSSFKRPKLEANHALLEEIRGINQRLIDTVVDISDEDVDQRVVAAAAEGNEGTFIKCSFNAVALSPNLKSQYTSAHMSPIQPLRLLVPTSYPNCSPILLDNFPVEVSKEHEDLSVKAKSRFSSSLRSLSQPMSLEEIAKTWDVCARGVILEYAQKSGGGSFSSKYGTWENCMMAA